MSWPERQRQFDALLLNFYELWHPQPFREPRPAWCERWPALAAELLALSEAELQHLGDDDAAGVALLAHNIPEVTELVPLASLPLRPLAALAEQQSRWAWEIPGRKRQQIEAFAATARSAGRPVIDWCGGKGHLGSLLAAQSQIPVQTLELDAVLCAEAEALAGRQALDHRFIGAPAQELEEVVGGPGADPSAPVVGLLVVRPDDLGWANLPGRSRQGRGR